MYRESKEIYYLTIAETTSRRSTCLKRHYGAVIVNGDEILSTGYNGAARGEPNCCDKYEECPRKDKEHNSGDYSDCPAVHAEMNAIISAARKDMIGSTLYLAGFDVEETHHGTDYLPINNPSPCPICMRLIRNAGIKKIITYGGTVDL